jgi:carbonic anhydrase
MRYSSQLTRRSFVATAAGVLFAGGGRGELSSNAKPDERPAGAMTPDQILAKLLDGNKRFADGQVTSPRRKPEDFARLAEGQNPRALIVGCADSRVAPELLFDQGVGDLFVVRVAGNVISGAGAMIKGSIEYAVAELGVSLVMVLGHSNCGAVKAAVKHIEANDALPGAINDLVSAIKPAVARAKGLKGDALENAIRANVETGVERLKGLEPIVAGPVKNGKVKVVGSVYDLHTGRVTVVA